METNDDEWEVSGNTPPGIQNHFRWSLQALATDAVDQLALFPDFVCKDFELLNDYDNWSRVARSWHRDKFSDIQLKAVAAVDNYIDSQYEQLTDNSETSSCEEQLTRIPEWEQLRELAKAALASFGWRAEVPPYGRSLYANGEHGPE